MMKPFFNNVFKANKEIYIKYLYISFVLSYLFNTAFKVSIWNNEIIAHYFRLAFNNVTLVKNFILIPLLLLSELINLLYKIYKKNCAKKYLLNLLVFIVVYAWLRIYGYGTYYWGYDEVILLIYFAKYLEFNKIIFLYTCSALISALFNIWGCLKGYLSIDGEGRGLVWGFSHSNQAAIFYTMLFFGIAYSVRKNKVAITIIALPFLYLDIAVFKSRTPSIIMTLFTVMLWLETIYNNLKLKKIIKIIYIFFPIIMTILAIYLGINYYNGVIKIDMGAGIRFKEIVMIYKEKGLALGNRHLSDLSRLYYFDNGYAWMIFRHGLLTSGLMYLIWILNGGKVVKDNNYIAMIINISLFIYMMMEYIFVNDLIFIMMTYLSSKNEISSKRF